MRFIHGGNLTPDALPGSYFAKTGTPQLTLKKIIHEMSQGDL